MKSKWLQGLAVVLILEVGLVHYFSSQHEFEESWILGYLFIANFLGALVAAYGIYRRKWWGWALGTFISLGGFFAYIWSRTTGLPGLRPEEWLFPWGVASLLVEGLFLVVVAVRPWRFLIADLNPIETQKRPARYLFPVAGLAILILFNLPFAQWDSQYVEYAHEHVFFLWQVKLQKQVSLASFEEEYGMNVSLAAVSAVDSIVDVRMKVIDPEKAEPQFEDGHFALLVGDTLIPAPHVSRHMLANKTIIVMFPNLKNIVRKGIPVSIVFENFRLEPVTVQ